jgi:hypothetical protein
MRVVMEYVIDFHDVRLALVPELSRGVDTARRNGRTDSPQRERNRTQRQVR